MNKNTNAGTGIPANGCNFLHKKNPLFDDKDTTADQKNNSLAEILTIQKWINDNFCSFTDAEICRKFDRTIPELWEIYKGNFFVNYPKFSYFQSPVTNTAPTKEIDLVQLHREITGDYYKKVTEQFRAMEAGAEKAEFKKTRFNHVTFAGTFTARKSDNLKSLSGYACFDFDHVQGIDVFKNLLASDIKLDTQMIFISPSGDGLKMILYNDDGAPYDQFYNGVTNYLKKNYSEFAPSLDGKTKDVARTCFICHDANCYIKPQYLELWQASQN